MRLARKSMCDGFANTTVLVHKPQYRGLLGGCEGTYGTRDNGDDWAAHLGRRTAKYSIKAYVR